MAGLKGKPVFLYASELLPEQTLVYLSGLVSDGKERLLLSQCTFIMYRFKLHTYLLHN